MRISRQLTDAVIGNFSRLDYLEEDINYYLSYVQNELKVMQVPSTTNYRFQRALLFALASPMNRFECNVVVAKRLHDRLYMFETVEDVYKALTEDNTSTITSGNVAKAIFKSLNYIKWATPVSKMGATLRAKNGLELFGAGPKVTAMAAHLWNEFDNVFTLDTHMLRLIMETTMGMKGNWDIKIPEYYQLEEKLLEFSDKFDASPFAVQWSMWCVQRKEFISHKGIFA